MPTRRSRSKGPSSPQQTARPRTTTRKPPSGSPTIQTTPSATQPAPAPDFPAIPEDLICSHPHCGGYILIAHEFTRDVDITIATCDRCARQYDPLPADPWDERPMSRPETTAAAPSMKTRREGRRPVARQKNPPPSDDISKRLRDLFQIKDRRTFKRAVLDAVMPYWEVAHPERPSSKGGAPMLSRQRVRDAWEQVYGELGLPQLLKLSWQDLVGRMQTALGRMKKGKKDGCFYSTSAITPHLRSCMSATLGQSIPDENLRKRLRGDKHWFNDLKAWLCMREGITPNSDVKLSALQGPAWDKVLHGNAFEAELKDDLTAIQRLYRYTRRPTNR